jgi:hypothetical protein
MVCSKCGKNITMAGAPICNVCTPIRKGYEIEDEDYWMHVRRTYLELGGEYIWQMRLQAQAEYLQMGYSA